MAEDFEAAITALWGRLKLGTPAFGPNKTALLAVDGINLQLNESADGRHIVISGMAGRLAPNPHRSEAQVRALLKANLGLLKSNRAGLSVDSSDAASPVRVTSTYAYALKRPELLDRLIEDVLYRVELHAGELTIETTRQAAGSKPTPQVSHETLIIRP